MQDEKKMGRRDQDGKKMGRQDARQKKWGDKTQDGKTRPHTQQH